MARSMSLKLACVVVLCLLVDAPLAQGAISYDQVKSSLLPCVGYVRGNNARPAPPNYCKGIRSLKSAARIRLDRQAACKCIKSLAADISDINYGVAAGLPGQCNVHIPYKISPSIDCKRVK
ncbi:hypothetical protein ERO13_D10G116500v2 [Gossypium hirsutum]|uniref:Non-specific lipid-transfer protein 6 n=3 Tax=Gossypium TaxID=3633 RepID=NLTP6_GOSHI|nr:non-specific lipid-transfer protein 6 [Gossypium hirsutum]O24418.1 RecName: Full=Non-specific lipid-transfer protein 6; Short=LTP; Flags: Precursor [Gossypium hirsutum]AAB66907.1 lipid transfer protein [Gossypium hirsutum]AFR43296.1 lipid transfer protein precursor [Gossypium barbadense]KAG4125752.1 hypothetical protein ERO13_D10G116500v2 [Gossypium hirsutum]